MKLDLYQDSFDIILLPQSFSFEIFSKLRSFQITYVRENNANRLAQKNVLRAPFFIEQLWWLLLTGIVASFVNFARFPTTPFLTEYLRWLLLAVESIDCRAFRDTAEKEEMINLSLTTH